MLRAGWPARAQRRAGSRPDWPQGRAGRRAGLAVA